MITDKCKIHLESVGETPFQHMWTALKIAVKLQLVIPAIIIHSVAPRFFTTTATDVMKDILEKRHGMDKE